MDFDFRGADRVDWSQVPPERRGANHFQSTELFARQLLYDLSYSVPHSGHEVRRHKDLEYGFARHQVGIRVALVYLVAQLDGDLNAAFETLWDRRPTLLHERLSKDDLLSKGLTLKLQHV